ncbi:hypothetical protein GCM10027271_37970 [Saccharopolyspora gloriosae]|uniref:PknH-like protein n=1 Tax=Saccharopolyspora gloriosae TaxID=455344 RepID=A0A840NJ42_9PSEU|nr:hypothetical protein [Saccharopolyspora gloriosae]MBB5069309.1 hypothetical protein [Saccharopolyspora gloriosae]
MTEDEAERAGKQPENSSGPSWTAIATVVAGVIAVFGFLGISNAEQLWRFVAADQPPSPSRIHDQDAPSEYPSTTEEPEESEEPSTSAEPTSEEAEPSAGEADLDTGDAETPFTRDALLPAGFTTAGNTYYALESAGSKPCGQAYGMDDGVTDVLTGYGCTGTMVGTYLVDSDTITADNQVLASVQVISFGSAAQARGAYDAFRDGGPWEFGIWCPRSGLGQNACSDGYESARNAQRIRVDERYLIAATAVYTSLNSAEPWITDAARKAASVCGPQ